MNHDDRIVLLKAGQLPLYAQVIRQSFSTIAKEFGLTKENRYAANGFVHTGTKKFKHLPFVVGFME